MVFRDLLGQEISIGDIVLHISGGNGCALRHRLHKVGAFTPKRIKLVDKSTPDDRLEVETTGWCETVTQAHVLVVNKLVA